MKNGITKDLCYFLFDNYYLTPNLREVFGIWIPISFPEKSKQIPAKKMKSFADGTFYYASFNLKVDPDQVLFGNVPPSDLKL